MTFLSKSNNLQRRFEAGEIDKFKVAEELLIAHAVLINEIEKLLDYGSVGAANEKHAASLLFDYLWKEIKEDDPQT